MAARLKKKKKEPLTVRAWRALKKHGAATADVVAKRCGVTSRRASHALSQLKRRGKSKFVTTRQGENVHRAIGKTP